jgi:transcriptional regulator with XRE-family HTH domain
MCIDLHQRLRQARERRGLSLTAIARARGVREEHLALIERNQFEELPTGLYGRNAVRAYAGAVGVPPDEALGEVAHRLREPEDPMDGLARVRGIERPRPRRVLNVAPSVARPVQLPLSWRAPAAAIIDSGLLLAIDAALLALTAAVAGVRPADILHLALPSMLVVFALIAATYYVLLGGIRRATIGAQIVRAESMAILDPAGVQAAMQRGIRSALAVGRLALQRSR